MVCINGSSDNKMAECFALFSAPTLKSIHSNMHTYTYIYNCTLIYAYIDTLIHTNIHSVYIHS